MKVVGIVNDCDVESLYRRGKVNVVVDVQSIKFNYMISVIMMLFD